MEAYDVGIQEFSFQRLMGKDGVCHMTYIHIFECDEFSVSIRSNDLLAYVNGWCFFFFNDEIPMKVYGNIFLFCFVCVMHADWSVLLSSRNEIAFT